MESESARVARNKGQEGIERLVRIAKEGFALIDEFCGSRPSRPTVAKPSHPPQGLQCQYQYHHQQASVHLVLDPQVFTVKQQRQPVITSDQAAHQYGGRVVVDHRAN